MSYAINLIKLFLKWFEKITNYSNVRNTSTAVSMKRKQFRKQSVAPQLQKNIIQSLTVQGIFVGKKIKKSNLNFLHKIKLLMTR